MLVEGSMRILVRFHVQIFVHRETRQPRSITNQTQCVKLVKNNFERLFCSNFRVRLNFSYRKTSTDFYPFPLEWIEIGQKDDSRDNFITMHDGENKWIDRAMATGVIPLWFMGGKFADINDTVTTGRAPPLDAISKIGSGSTPASIVSTRSKRSQSRDDCSVKTALPRYFASFSPRPRALQRRGGSWKHGRVFPLLPFCVLPPTPNRINRQIYWTRRDRVNRLTPHQLLANI